MACASMRAGLVSAAASSSANLAVRSESAWVPPQPSASRRASSPPGLVLPLLLPGPWWTSSEGFTAGRHAYGQRRPRPA